MSSDKTDLTPSVREEAAQTDSDMSVDEYLAALHAEFDPANDLLTDYERISDHCSNVAVDLLETEKDEFKSHEYHKSLEYRQNEQYNSYFNYYKGKYSLENQ